MVIKRFQKFQKRKAKSLKDIRSIKFHSSPTQTSFLDYLQRILLCQTNNIDVISNSIITFNFDKFLFINSTTLCYVGQLPVNFFHFTSIKHKRAFQKSIQLEVFN